MSKSNTSDIKFDDFMLGQYLFENRNTNLSKVIFSVRSKTFDIKVWQQWKYEDNLCILCQVKEENMDHFVICSSYSNQSSNIVWKDMLGNNVDRQFEIAQFLYERQMQRDEAMILQKGGQPLNPGSGAPAS